MSAVLAELGRQLAGRWAALLLLPGALYMCTATVAVLLGQGDALGFGRLGGWLDSVAAAPASGRFGTVLIAAAGFTAASAAAGAAASGAAQLVERVWWASGEEPLLRLLTARRSRAWERAEEDVRAALREFTASGGAPRQARALRAAIVRRDAICPEPASRPTWVGDRMYAVDQRVHEGYHLDLTAAWPRLWLVMPDAARAELVAARTGCGAAARLAGWGLLYVPLAALWWPAAVLAAGVLVAARHRARLAAAVQADLVEAAVDLYGRELVVRLGIDCPGRLTPEAGDAANSLLRKDRTDLSRFGG
ncbi:hypothetical protein [Streptomyces sp. SID2888]|uniref:hypothetical protein n=1 Tax=Streptomyces TaxID=1883 RepID=UPI00136E4965|nr:hypothetical protein [Streptomyces sp. SID2888]MYV44208.1 hypothetical protein [Streptomyces sp. SID2888]